jgi:hypothetical protein
MWPRCSSIMAPDQIWPMGLAMPLPGDVRGAAVHRLEQAGEGASGLMLAEGATPMVPVQAGPRSERMSPNRLLATTTSNQSGASRSWRSGCRCGTGPRDVGVVRPHGLHALVPPGHGDGDAVGLGGRGELLARAALRRARRRTSAPGRRRGGSSPSPGSPPRGRCPRTSCRRRWSTRPRCSRAPRRSRCRRAAVGEGALDAGQQPAGAQVDVLVEARRNCSSEPHSEMWSGTVAGQPTAP